MTTVVPAPIYGRHGMVVSCHPLASMAGWRALQQGGTAADAAVAAAAMLAVVLPNACTLGGDVFALVHDMLKGRTWGLNGSGPAPLAAAPDSLPDDIPTYGAASVSTPGALAGWHALHGRFGKLPWADLLDGAAAVARDGVPVCRSFARAARAAADRLLADPGCRAIFLADGAPLTEGSLLRQEALARTLAAVAADGPAAFYEGDAARSAEHLMRDQGGFLRADDLRQFEPEWVEPIAAVYAGATVLSLPPNTCGLYLLMQLNAIEGTNWADLGPAAPDRYSLLIGAAEAAFALGRPYVADPASGPAPVDEALAPGMTTSMRQHMADRRRDRAPANVGGTAAVTVADGEGNGVTLIQSIFHSFGAGVLDPASGVLFNNRMNGFTDEPGLPNRLTPGRRPAHTLCPSMVLSGGRLQYLAATPGGPGQTLALAQLYNGLLDYRMDLADAVHAPRWSMDLAGRAILEDAMRAPLAAALEARGLAVRVAPGQLAFGNVSAIERRPDGTLAGAADHRRDGYAIGA